MSIDSIIAMTSFTLRCFSKEARCLRKKGETHTIWWMTDSSKWKYLIWVENLRKHLLLRRRPEERRLTQFPQERLHIEGISEVTISEKLWHNQEIDPKRKLSGPLSFPSLWPPSQEKKTIIRRPKTWWLLQKNNFIKIVLNGLLIKWKFYSEWKIYP